MFKNYNVTLVSISVVGDLFKGFDFRLLSGDGIGEMRINLLKLLLNRLYLRMKQIGIIHQDLLSTFFALKCRQKATTVKTRDQTNFAIIITWRKTYLIGCYLVGSNLIRLIYTIYVICRLAIIRQILEKLKKSFNSCNIFFSFIISL